MTTSSPSPDLTLAAILSAFGTLPPKEKKSSKPASPANSIPLPFAKAFAKAKTGYVSWTATHKIIQIQPQICNCCGEEIEVVKGEFFALSNGLAHATWERVEAYGIIAPEELPNIFVDLEPTHVTACAACRSTPIDDFFSPHFPKQLSLEL